MPRNPRAYRIAQDTGMVEYDDSLDNIEGECPQCHRIHSGTFQLCDGCIEYNDPRNHGFVAGDEESDYNLEREWQEHLEELAQDDHCAKNIFDGTPDWLRME